MFLYKLTFSQISVAKKTCLFRATNQSKILLYIHWLAIIHVGNLSNMILIIRLNGKFPDDDVG